MRIYFYIIISSFLFLSSCNYKISKATSEDSRNKSFQGTDILFVNSQTIMEQVLVSCKNCHSSMGDIGGIRSQIARVQDSVFGNRMPKAGPLSDCAKALLNSWVSNGMPDETKIQVSSLSSCREDGGSQGGEAPVLNPPLPESDGNEGSDVEDIEPVVTQPESEFGKFVDVNTIMNKTLVSCKSCHREMVNSDAIRSKIDSIRDSVEDDWMPFGNRFSKLNACDKATLTAWSAGGMLETSTLLVSSLEACRPVSNPGEVSPVEVPVPIDVETPLAILPLNFSTFENRILEKHCTSCHNSSSIDFEASEILFSPFLKLKENPKYLGTGSTDSRIYKRINRDDDLRMPPLSFPSLNQEELDFVKRWIDAGAPES